MVGAVAGAIAGPWTVNRRMCTEDTTKGGSASVSCRSGPFSGGANDEDASGQVDETSRQADKPPQLLVALAHASALE